MTPFDRLAAREFFGIKLGLDNVRALVEALDHPERAAPAIIVAGTNGKGSTAAFTACALQAAGHRVGLYTSPHLIDLTERYRIDDVAIGRDSLGVALERVLGAEDTLRRDGRMTTPATYFELTTVAAFEVFRTSAIDLAVLEVGMGGRYDATNVVGAAFAAITSIALDHTAYLGDTLEAIAWEKGGVITRDGLVVSGVRHHGASRVIEDIARGCEATLIDAYEGTTLSVSLRGHQTWMTLNTPAASYGPLRLALNGRHQADNATVAVRLLERLHQTGIAVPHAAIEAGLRDASWPARLQVIERPGLPLVVVDGAHNAAGAEALAAWLRESGLPPLTLVVAMMRDKDRATLLPPLLACAADVVATTVLPPRGLAADELASDIRRLAPDMPVTVAAHPRQALTAALARGSPVVVAGSLFLAGAVLADLADVARPA